MNTFCSYYNQKICSSCSRIEIDYPTQLKTKFDKLNMLLDPLGPFKTLPAVSSKETGFRNKAKFSITGTLEHPIVGLTGEKDLDLGRDITNCPLHHPLINDLASKLSDFIKLMKLHPYQIKDRKGELKGAIVYYSPETNEMYLRLILRSKESLDRIKKHTHELKRDFPHLTCISANIQPIPHAILEGAEEIFFTEQTFIHHQVLNTPMTLHPQGFVQTNQDVAGKLYSTAAHWAKELGPKKFLELFSGQGAFSFFIQEFVSEALGIEINPEAVERANQTAKEKGWRHLKFLAQDAGKVEATALQFSPDLILVNPPRRGLGEARELLKKIEANYFIYSSCNAESLAQDLIELKDHYQIVKAQVFDMFPHTEHFETLVLLKSISGGKKL